MARLKLHVKPVLGDEHILVFFNLGVEVDNGAPSKSWFDALHIKDVHAVHDGLILEVPHDFLVFGEDETYELWALMEDEWLAFNLILRIHIIFLYLAVVLLLPIIFFDTRLSSFQEKLNAFFALALVTINTAELANWNAFTRIFRIGHQQISLVACDALLTLT